MNQAGAQVSKKRDPGSRWLVWSFNDRLFAVDLARVFQVIEKAPLFPVPLTSMNTVGVIYYQEEAIPVIHPGTLPGRLQGESRPEILPELILLVEWDKKKIGIPVDRVIRVVEDFDIEDAVEGAPDVSGFPVEAIGMYSGRMLYRLDMEELLSALRGDIEARS